MKSQTKAGKIVLQTNKVDDTDRQLLDALEQVGHPLMVLDKDFTILKVNKQQEEYTHTKREHTVGKYFFEAFPTLAKPHMPHRKQFEKAILTKKPIEFETYSELMDAWFELRVYPADNGIVLLWQDITPRVKAMEESEQQRQFYEAVTSSTLDLIYVIDLDYRFRYANKALLDMWGIKTVDEAMGKGLRELGYEEWHAAMHEKEIDIVAESKKPIRGEVSFPHATLGKRIYDYIFTPILDEKGDVVSIAGTTRDITELKRAEKDRRKKLEAEQRTELLMKQRNGLIEINKAKDEFVALASHQLRTPATAVKQYTDMLLHDFAGPLTEQQSEFVRIAYESNERQLRIINDLLKTAQIDSRGYRLNRELSNIVRLIEEVVADLKVTLDQRRQTVSFNCDRAKIIMNVDATEMKLAISNLIENASKYSYADSEIKVTVSAEDGRMIISICDNGVGIRHEDYGKIFQKFTRVGNPLTDDVTGNGLGLFWVKQIAEMHDGEVEIESTPGKGSTFTIKLPLLLKVKTH